MLDIVLPIVTFIAGAAGMWALNRMHGRLLNLEAQIRVHAGILAGADPSAVKSEAEHVQEWLDLYNAEPDGTPKKQALRARLAARGMTFD